MEMTESEAITIGKLMGPPTLQDDVSALKDGEEIWKSVPNFSGYLVSNMGRVRSIKFDKDRFMRLSENDRYPNVGLCVNGKQITKKVHRLVLLAFVGSTPDGMEVRHLNGIRTDNRLVNLAYGTKKENGADTVRHGRNRNTQKTQCPSGHPFNSTNTFVVKHENGSEARHCRVCDKERARIRRAQKIKKMWDKDGNEVAL